MSEDMDDRELRQAFEEYTDGVDAPPASVTEKAKNQIIKDRAKSRHVKRITATAACVACACLVTVGAILLPIITVGSNKANGAPGLGSTDSSGSSGEHNSSDPTPPSDPDKDSDHSGGGQGGGQSVPDMSGGWITYPQSGLTQSTLDMNGDLPAGLEFVKTAKAWFSVTNLTGNYQGDELRYAQAEVTYSTDGAESVATVYTEFTESSVTCEIFTEYLAGERYNYKGNFCLISDAVQDGKAVTKVFLKGENVKYYLTVSSPDPDCYTLYLDFILGE